MSIDRRNMGYVPLRDAIDRLFAGSVITPQVFGQESFPQADLYTTEDDVVVCMSIPGANPDDIQISVTGDTVTIAGEVRHEHSNMPQAQQSPQGQGQQAQQGRQRQGHQVYYQEIWSGRFQRSFGLPIQVDADKANASFENGILTLTLPKAEATKPRKIQVQSRQTVQGQTGRQGGSGQSENVPVSGSE
jgi:HSP20 family protein